MTPQQVDWSGVFPAVTTQFYKDGALNVAGTLDHIDALVDGGIHGLIVLGTVGENCSLEYEEKLEIVREVSKHLDGRLPVLTGVAEYTTALACRFAADAQQAGAEGLMVLPAMVYKSDPRETTTHFREVAKASDLPIMCYNNPVSYGVDVSPSSFAELADVPSIVAIKESSEDVRRITDLYNECGDRFLLFAGVDDLALESVMLGAVGWVSGLVNAFPRENRKLWDLAQAGNYQDAVPIYRWYTPLLHLDTLPKLVQYIKLANQEVGYGTETVRAPRLPLEGEEREWCLKVIRDALASRPNVD